jgi:hypothetical protein
MFGLAPWHFVLGLHKNFYITTIEAFHIRLLRRSEGFSSEILDKRPWIRTFYNP